MGIVNATPDSFSDGGRFDSVEDAVRCAERMVAEGADIIDIGGESTRPGAPPVSAEEEMRRVLPLVEALHHNLSVPLSIDTMKAAVARAACDRGASIINDVSALSADPDMPDVVRDYHTGVVLMHMQGTPQTMQKAPSYDNVVEEVDQWLQARIDAALAHGIARAQIALDPGIGFGKTLDHNLALINAVARFAAHGCPVLMGMSRKRFIGDLSGVTSPEARLPGSLAALTVAVLRGAHILRVHDVQASAQAARVATALKQATVPAEVAA